MKFVCESVRKPMRRSSRVAPLPGVEPSSGRSSLTVAMLGETSSSSRTRPVLFRSLPGLHGRQQEDAGEDQVDERREAYRARPPTAKRSTGYRAGTSRRHKRGPARAQELARRAKRAGSPHASRRETTRSAGGARIPFVTADRSCRGASPRLHGGGRRIAIDVITESHGHCLFGHQGEQQQQE